ncbi:hypothetical protein VUR80DRAFT_2524 [Thermomyces stellatus]
MRDPRARRALVARPHVRVLVCVPPGRARDWTIPSEHNVAENRLRPPRPHPRCAECADPASLDLPPRRRRPGRATETSGARGLDQCPRSWPLSRGCCPMQSALLFPGHCWVIGCQQAEYIIHTPLSPGVRYAGSGCASRSHWSPSLAPPAGPRRRPCKCTCVLKLLPATAPQACVLRLVFLPRAPAVDSMHLSNG